MSEPIEDRRDAQSPRSNTSSTPATETAPARLTAGVIAPPPLIYAVPLIIGLIVHRWHPQPVLPAQIARIAGIVCIVLGFIGMPAAIAFFRAGTSVKPWQPSTALVTTGIYRFTRNPMYVGFALWYVGVSLLVNSLWPLLLFPVVLAVMHFGVIRREEAYLERVFRTAYVNYRRQTRRWL